MADVGDFARDGFLTALDGRQDLRLPSYGEERDILFWDVHDDLDGVNLHDFRHRRAGRDVFALLDGQIVEHPVDGRENMRSVQASASLLERRLAGRQLRNGIVQILLRRRVFLHQRRHPLVFDLIAFVSGLGGCELRLNEIRLELDEQIAPPHRVALLRQNTCNGRRLFR